MTEERDATAGPKLAAIPEVVDKILLDLPLLDIVVAQRVDRMWQGLIWGSSKLQKAIFLRPTLDEPLRMAGVRIWSMFPCERGESTCDKKPITWAREGRDGDNIRIIVNPFLLHEEDSVNSFEAGLSRFGAEVGLEASLWTMYLTQLPVKEVFFGTASKEHILRCESEDGGITVRDMVEAARAFEWHEDWALFSTYGAMCEVDDASEYTGKIMLAK